MPARAVSPPTAFPRTRSPESVATVPATTCSPSVRLTVWDSPVIIDSSMLAVPWTTTPSAGTLPPGRMITTSPTPRSPGATVSVPSSTTRSASSGSSAASESRAELVCASELPPELESVIEEADRCAPGGEEGDGDAETDEQHHPGLAGPDLVGAAAEERATAPDVHHRA